MQHTITLTEILEHGDFTIRFADKQFAANTLEELLAFSESELEAISGRLLRSLLMRKDKLAQPNGNCALHADLSKIYLPTGE